MKQGNREKKEKGQALGTKLGGVMTSNPKKPSNIFKRIRAWLNGTGWQYHHLDKLDRKGKKPEEIQKLRQKSYSQKMKLQAKQGY